MTLTTASRSLADRLAPDLMSAGFDAFFGTPCGILAPLYAQRAGSPRACARMPGRSVHCDNERFPDALRATRPRGSAPGEAGPGDDGPP